MSVFTSFGPVADRFDEALESENFRADRWSAVAIRSVDVVVSLIALLVFLPLFCAIAICVFAASPGPVLFRQKRIGLNGRPFLCLKFRTMAVDANERLALLLRFDPVAREEWERDHKLRNDPRVVGIGNFLRRSSLDELPQLINILFGDMSLVGPRPIVDAEVARYGRYFANYCAVRLGLTGLWQISGRNDVSYRRRVAFDVIYSRTRTVSGDIKILFGTIPSVLLARGSY